LHVGIDFANCSENSIFCNLRASEDTWSVLFTWGVWKRRGTTRV